MPRYDDVVVGAGILGLAHAYHLGAHGRRVLVVERASRAQGASVRNFGMVWPIGQPAGPLRNLALRSRDLWVQILYAAGLWYDEVGSLHVARHDDEAQVLEEFAAGATASSFACDLVSAAVARRLSPFLRESGLRAALWSPNEVCVDPRVTVAGLPAWLSAQFGVEFRFQTQVVACSPGVVTATTGQWEAERVWVCTGDDLQTLFPGLLQSQKLRRCKLQMMRTAAAPFRIGPMLAGGLTLLHYRSFLECPSHAVLEARLDEELPRHRQFGIHVMVSQNGAGELVVGDSHEYDGDITPFDRSHIDDLVLEYLDTFFARPALPIAQRWHGIYVKHPEQAWVELTPAPGIVVVTGVGGHGMTLSFGLAEQIVQQHLGLES